MKKYNGLYKSKNGEMLVSLDLSLEKLMKICDEKFKIIVIKNDKTYDDSAELLFWVVGDKKE